MKKKYAIITGGSRGIGAEISRALVKSFNLIIIFKSDDDSAKALKSELLLIRADAEVILFKKNIADEDLIKSLVAHVGNENLEQVGVLINNAGVQSTDPILLGDYGRVTEHFNINFFPAIRLIYFLAPIFRKNKFGRIINLSSTAASRPWLGSLAYSSSKQALEAASRSAAVELAKYNVTSNCIVPGFIKTDMIKIVDSIQTKNDGQKAIEKTIPLGRIGEAQEVAGLVEFLTSEKGSYISGAEYRIDGALALKVWPESI